MIICEDYGTRGIKILLKENNFQVIVFHRFELQKLLAETEDGFQIKKKFVTNSGVKWHLWRH